MFKDFLNFFDTKRDIMKENEEYEYFMDTFSGRQFGEGLFNVFHKEELLKWTRIVQESFPNMPDSFDLIGFDWLGDCFAIVKDGVEKGKVVLFEIGTGQILIIGNSFKAFIKDEVPSNYQACFASNFYQQWLQAKGSPVSQGRCVGYMIPLFLGGQDDISNLEDNDMEVYWSIMSQIIKQISVER